MITSFSTLKVAIADWLDRDDLGSSIDTFIALMEAHIYRELRIQAMEKALSATVSSGVISVPSDYVELNFAYIDANPVTALQMRSTRWIYERFPTRAASGRPLNIAREGDNFIFGPYPDSDYSVKGVYYAKLTALSVSNETNWFTTNAPDLLLFGSLVAATPYIGDDERAMVWKLQFEEALKALKAQEMTERFTSRGPLTASVG